MKLLIGFLSLMLLTFSSFSQQSEKDRYQVDSLQVYSPETNTYTFYLEAGSQGLFIPKMEVVWLPGIEVKIINNTGKTIVNDFREHDGHLMWYRTRWDRIVAPGEEMIVVSKWLAQGMPRLPFSKAIEFNYQMDDTQHHFMLRTWGEFEINLDEQQRIIAKKERNTQAIEKTPEIIQPVFTKHYDTIQVIKKKSYYKGEQVNQHNRKGFKVGKWVTFQADNQLKSMEYYSGDYHWDSAYFFWETTGRREVKLYHIQLSDSAIKKQTYNDQGVLTKTYFWNGTERLEPQYTYYYESGELRQASYPYPEKRILDYYKSGQLQKKRNYNYEGKIDTITYFYESGVIEKVEILNKNEQPLYRYWYDQDGDLITREDIYRRTTISWKYLSKTDSSVLVKRFYNGKHSWTDSGAYRNNDLWQGQRVSTQGGIYSLPKVFEKGKENGFYYENEWVNKSDSLRQQGKWMTFHKSGAIKELNYYKNGVRDSLFRYYESGAIQEINYSRGPFSQKRRQLTNFYENGKLLFEQGGFEGDTVSVTYGQTGQIDKMKTRNGFNYQFEAGSKCTYTIIRPSNIKIDRYERDVLYGINSHEIPTDYGPMEDHYKNCTLYKRISSRYYYVSGIEGRSTRSSNYTIDIGTFQKDELYNGKREFYNVKGALMRTVRVKGGKEL